MAVGLLDLPSQGRRRGHKSIVALTWTNIGILGQKLTAMIRILAYGSSADQVDEIARMRKSITLESLARLCDAIETLYTRDYLCKPTA
ncbi:hypothetical protein L3X38_009093 [Prunus dulcis]|uniref:Uncharacterized protein n=1 Tax=Prunus dulcis TaxID=3755 RepID=A0AAD4ZXP5_PRUDU|nr:hypothetical protein L3X38_009093 [Prunus dulcis]